MRLGVASATRGPGPRCRRLDSGHVSGCRLAGACAWRLVAALAAARASCAVEISPPLLAGAGAPLALAIPALQGASHRSPFEGALALTSGVVTSVGASGFTLQDPTGDADPATSDALFVYTAAPPGVAPGDHLRVLGRVAEFVPGGASTGNLSSTEIERPLQIERLGTLAAPAPVLLGAGGRPPPPHPIDDDGLARFEPERDAIDFLESLESMRVELPDALAAAPSDRFGAIYALSATGPGLRSARGVRVRQPADDVAELLRIAASAEGGTPPPVAVGAQLGPVVGVLGYRYGRYELTPEASLSPEPGALFPEATGLLRGPEHWSVASYNVANLSPDDPPQRYAGLADQIVGALGAPDVVALQEVQDGSGSRDDGVTSAARTGARLVDAIRAAGGPAYHYAELEPEDAADGGAPGANIRVAYLYDPSRVSLRSGSLERWGARGERDAAAFAASRKPLFARFEFGAHELAIVNLHLSSRVGSDPAFGAEQPPRIAGEAARRAQARAVAERVAALLREDPDSRLLVLGDFNASLEEEALALLLDSRGPGLVSLDQRGLAPGERYSFLFEGAGSLLDHALASPALAAAALPELDVVHLNSEFPGAWSDHDPLVVRLFLPVPEPRTGPLLGVAGVFLTRFARRIKKALDPADHAGREGPGWRFRASASGICRPGRSSTAAPMPSSFPSRRAAAPGCASSCATTSAPRRAFPSP